MGMMWQAENCDRCAKDHRFSHVADDEQDDSAGCPVILAMMLHEYPIEGLIRHEDRLFPAELQCTYFTPCQEGDCSVPEDYRPSSWQEPDE